MERSNAPLFEGEAQAAEFLQGLGFDKPGPIPVEELAYYAGIRIVTGPLDGAEARLTRLGDLGLMRLSDRLSDENRRRFSIGHEVGHWLMDRDAPAVFQCDGGIERSSSVAVVEERANAFACALLMPRPLVEPMINRKELSLDILEDIARTFRVSLTASAQRFLRFTTESLYIVRVGEDGKILWWRRSAKAGLFLGKRQSVDQGTLTAQVLKGRESGERNLAVVETSSWFHELPWGRKAEVKEVTVPMRSYGGALTFLSTVEYEVETRRGRHREDDAEDE